MLRCWKWPGWCHAACALVEFLAETDFSPELEESSPSRPGSPRWRLCILLCDAAAGPDVKVPPRFCQGSAKGLTLASPKVRAMSGPGPTIRRGNFGRTSVPKVKSGEGFRRFRTVLLRNNRNAQELHGVTGFSAGELQESAQTGPGRVARYRVVHW